jgi:hypothetical protein
MTTASDDTPASDTKFVINSQSLTNYVIEMDRFLDSLGYMNKLIYSSS